MSGHPGFSFISEETETLKTTETVVKEKAPEKVPIDEKVFAPFARLFEWFEWGSMILMSALAIFVLWGDLADYEKNFNVVKLENAQKIFSLEGGSTGVFIETRENGNKLYSFTGYNFWSGPNLIALIIMFPVSGLVFLLHLFIGYWFSRKKNRY